MDERSRQFAVKVHLHQSKYNQLGKGVNVVVGHTDIVCCTVAVVVSYISLSQGCPGAFFLFRDRTPLTKSWFVQQIRATPVSLDLLQDQYAVHSFWTGATTTVAMVGIEDSTIQGLRHWQSAEYLQYIQVPRDDLADTSRQLAES